ncbi:MAG: anti-sigma F factor antagonist [Firmicutes bacterium]|nr:anti-sigma F factor antagonist [Bacillota bacterium]
MQINYKIINKNLIIDFNGELDHHTASDIRKQVDELYSEKMLHNIILDLDNLNFMDSSGIGLIMGRYKTVSQNGGKVCLINANNRIQKILKMSGILKIVHVYDNLNEALDNI